MLWKLFRCLVDSSEQGWNLTFKKRKDSAVIAAVYSTCPDGVSRMNYSKCQRMHDFGKRACPSRRGGVEGGCEERKKATPVRKPTDFVRTNRKSKNTTRFLIGIETNKNWSEVNESLQRCALDKTERHNLTRLTHNFFKETKFGKSAPDRFFSKNYCDERCSEDARATRCLKSLLVRYREANVA